MTGLLVASLAMETAAAVTAVLLAWRRPDHRPAAGALVLLAVASLVRVPLNAALSPHPVEPWQGEMSRPFSYRSMTTLPFTCRPAWSLTAARICSIGKLAAMGTRSRPAAIS